jgi:hypothetical protein
MDRHAHVTLLARGKSGRQMLRLGAAEDKEGIHERRARQGQVIRNVPFRAKLFLCALRAAPDTGEADGPLLETD